MIGPPVSPASSPPPRAELAPLAKLRGDVLSVEEQHARDRIAARWRAAAHALMTPLVADTLLAELTALAPDARAWLEASLRDASALGDRKRLRTLFAQSARKLRGADQRTISLGHPASPRTLLDLARAALLRAALAVLPDADHVALLDELYRTGEQREQASILRALPLLPAPERFLELAIHACRTNSLDVFRAIAIENEYPSSHFPELHLNQLVLKAIFLGVPVHGIVGLPRRATPELRRMVSEYETERRAAGRPIPDDVPYVIALCDR